MTLTEFGTLKVGDQLRCNETHSSPEVRNHICIIKEIEYAGICTIESLTDPDFHVHHPDFGVQINAHYTSVDLLSHDEWIIKIPEVKVSFKRRSMLDRIE